jgi:hypothetical protein
MIFDSKTYTIVNWFREFSYVGMDLVIFYRFYQELQIMAYRMRK